MIHTQYGVFNGDSWEVLCQLIFKRKYADLDYQEMVASPGDFGIEGFTKIGGLTFQCYCPDHNYTQAELYEKQRDKITTDIKKIKLYHKDITKRMGNTPIKKWYFITPIVTNNDLLAHAEKKRVEVLSWALSNVDPSFDVIIKDASFYAVEIQAIQASRNQKLTLFSPSEIAEDLSPKEVSEYEDNISRKNEARCTNNGNLQAIKHQRLNRITSDKWLAGDLLLGKIEKDSPELYFSLMRVIYQYESELEEMCLTWEGEANELVGKVKDSLALRIKEAIPSLGEAERYRLSDQMAAKWLALCPLDIIL